LRSRTAKIFIYFQIKNKRPLHAHHLGIQLKRTKSKVFLFTCMKFHI
jgi:hypothetical protein